MESLSRRRLQRQSGLPSPPHLRCVVAVLDVLHVVHAEPVHGKPDQQVQRHRVEEDERPREPGVGRQSQVSFSISFAVDHSLNLS